MLYSQMAARLDKLIHAQAARLENSGEEMHKFLSRKEERVVSAEITSLNAQMHAIEEVSF